LIYPISKGSVRINPNFEKFIIIADSSPTGVFLVNTIGTIEFDKRLLKSIQDQKGFERKTTISFGESTLRINNTKNDKTAVKHILAEADKALYHSKNSGRNRLFHFDDIPKSATVSNK